MSQPSGINGSCEFDLQVRFIFFDENNLELEFCNHWQLIHLSTVAFPLVKPLDH